MVDQPALPGRDPGGRQDHSTASAAARRCQPIRVGCPGFWAARSCLACCSTARRRSSGVAAQLAGETKPQGCPPRSTLDRRRGGPLASSRSTSCAITERWSGAAACSRPRCRIARETSFARKQSRTLIDRVRIQERLDQLLAEAEKLRHALVALDRRGATSSANMRALPAGTSGGCAKARPSRGQPAPQRR